VYILIEDKDKEEYQKKFERILKYKTTVLKHEPKENLNEDEYYVGIPGQERLKAHLYWSSENKYWFATEKLPKDTRYWNILGMKKPEENKVTITMDGQINFSKKGWRAEGKLVRDTSTKKIFVAHTGGFKGNEKNGGRLKGNISEEKATFNIICEFPQDESESECINFQIKVKNFIEELKKGRQKIKNKNLRQTINMKF